MEQHKWDLQYDNNPNDTLTGAAHFKCSCALVMSGPRAEVLRLLYEHLPKDWWPTWVNGVVNDRAGDSLS